MVRKKAKKYYFSVEGETEQWYLYWLKDLINKQEQSRYIVVIDCKVEVNPYKRAKKMTITSKTEIWHLSDYESNDEAHVRRFNDTIDNMKKATSIGKNIVYKFGYSNFTFDLWMILHKMDCYGPKTDRKQYIHSINRAFDKNFQSMNDYKHHDHFLSCLDKLDLDDVKKAIERSKHIMEENKNNGYVLQRYKGYSFYRENPSLMIWEIVEKILKDCNLI